MQESYEFFGNNEFPEVAERIMRVHREQINADASDGIRTYHRPEAEPRYYVGACSTTTNRF